MAAAASSATITERTASGVSEFIADGPIENEAQHLAGGVDLHAERCRLAHRGLPSDDAVARDELIASA